MKWIIAAVVCYGGTVALLGRADISVPIGNRTETGPGVQIHAGQAKGWWNECTSLLAVGTQSFAVFVQFCIEAAGTPSGENLLHGLSIDAEEIGKRLEIRCQRHDRADVQITVGPAIKPMTDARRERVVDGRMAKRALDAHRFNAAIGIGEGRDTGHRVQL